MKTGVIKQTKIILKSGYVVNTYCSAKEIVDVLKGKGDAITIGESFILTNEIAAVLEEE